MKITNVRTAVIAGNFPWVLVKIDTDVGVTGLGEAYWGAGVGGFIHLDDRPGHGLTLDEDVARAHLKPGSSFFGDTP